MATTKKAAVAKKPVRERKARISVSELNLQKAGSRLLASKLVSTEVSYLQKNLGSSATQEDLDAKVLAVRAMPWASISEQD